MKKTISILSAFAILLCLWLVALWLPALTEEGKPQSETRYGVSEGLELVEQTFAGKEKKYVVEDDRGNVVFAVPLRGCIIDTRYRGGRLRFREEGSRREGYIDRQGIVTFFDEGKASIPEQVATGTTARFATSDEASARQEYGEASGSLSGGGASKPSGAGRRSLSISQVPLKTIAKDNAFFKEASKILQGKLTFPAPGVQRQGTDYRGQCGEDSHDRRQVYSRTTGELRHPLQAAIYGTPHQGVCLKQ